MFEVDPVKIYFLQATCLEETQTLKIKHLLRPRYHLLLKMHCFNLFLLFFYFILFEPKIRREYLSNIWGRGLSEVVCKKVYQFWRPALMLKVEMAWGENFNRFMYDDHPSFWWTSVRWWDKLRIFINPLIVTLHKLIGIQRSHWLNLYFIGKILRCRERRRLMDIYQNALWVYDQCHFIKV